MRAKILLFAVAVALCSGLAFGMALNDPGVEIVGVAQWYGAAPFEKLCLKSKDGKLYYLDASVEVRNKISALTGYRICVEGILTDAMPPVEVMKATVLKVEKWRKL